MTNLILRLMSLASLVTEEPKDDEHDWEINHFHCISNCSSYQPLSTVCDGKEDCLDGSDEAICHNWDRIPYSSVIEAVGGLEANISEYRLRLADLKNVSKSIEDQIPSILDESAFKERLAQCGGFVCHVHVKLCKLFVDFIKEINDTRQKYQNMKHELLEPVNARLTKLDVDVTNWESQMKHFGNLINTHRQLCDGTYFSMTWGFPNCKDYSKIVDLIKLWLLRYKIPFQLLEKKLVATNATLQNTEKKLNSFQHQFRTNSSSRADDIILQIQNIC